MIASLNWLKEIIDINLSKSELVKKLTYLGLECSDENRGPSFEGVFVGKINNVKKLANSDHLSICNVDVGMQQKINIVCGAPNVKTGILVPVAVIGANLLNGKLKIKKSKIRGELSHGMICSEKELEIGENDNGIMILDDYLKIGEKLDTALNLSYDTLIDFDLTPNRGDCLSYLGIAREIAILESQDHSALRKKIIDLLSYEYPQSSEKIEEKISIKIEDVDACPFYVGKIIKDIQIKESPQWLKTKLKSHNMKPVNIVVDLTNYVMLSIGQPMHTFDFDKIKTNEINVGFSKNNNKIETLDSTNRKISQKNLLIKDGQNPIAIAGVMGGKNTEIKSTTKSVFIESALFNPIIIRKSAKSIDLSTDASRRYERSVDPEMVNDALEILTGLIIKYCGGEALKGSVFKGEAHDISKKVTFELEACNDFLGTNLSSKQVSNILNKVGIKNDYNDNEYVCYIPSYRSHDVMRDVDIYEEIARVYGFDNIESSKAFSVNFSSIKKSLDLSDNLKLNVSSKGFIEHYSNSLISDKEHKYFAIEDGVSVSNPLNKNMKYVRNSIAIGLIKAVSFNQSRKNNNFKLFEIGATYQSFDKSPPIEDMCIGMAWPENRFISWKDKDKKDFFNAKGDMNSVLDQLNISNYQLKEINKKGFEICLSIISRNKSIGYIGIIHPNILADYRLDKNLVYAEMSLNKLNEILLSDNKYEEPSIYPTVERDISILVSTQYSSEDIMQTIKKAGGKFLNRVYLFDVYKDKSIDEHFNSYAYKMVFQSHDNTLKDHDVDLYINKILKKLKKDYKIKQR